MIKRTGFVSNSSSSSFFLDRRNYSVEIVEEYFRLLIQAEAWVNPEYKDFDVEMTKMFLIIREIEDCALLEEKLFEKWYSGKELKKVTKEFQEQFPEGVIWIRSLQENSIPRFISDRLYDLGLYRNW